LNCRILDCAIDIHICNDQLRFLLNRLINLENQLRIDKTIYLIEKYEIVYHVVKNHTIWLTFDYWTSFLLRLFLSIWYVSTDSSLETFIKTLKNDIRIQMRLFFATLSRLMNIELRKTIFYSQINQMNLRLSRQNQLYRNQIESQLMLNDTICWIM
jgi:hypothetical protein